MFVYFEFGGRKEEKHYWIISEDIICSEHFQTTQKRKKCIYNLLLLLSLLQNDRRYDMASLYFNTRIIISILRLHALYLRMWFLIMCLKFHWILIKNNAYQSLCWISWSFFYEPSWHPTTSKAAGHSGCLFGNKFNTNVLNTLELRFLKSNSAWIFVTWLQWTEM